MTIRMIPKITTLQFPNILDATQHLLKNGITQLTENNLFYLKIDDDYAHQLFPLLCDDQIKKPDDFGSQATGAHISIIYPEESKIINEEDLNVEHSFCVKDIIAAEIGKKIYYALFVESPSLLRLRHHYGLPDLLCFKGYTIGFHITIGVKSLVQPTNLTIWVDADACPKLIKEILYRAANRTKIKVVFVSNHILTTPSSPYISKLQVEKGFDIADDKILNKILPGDVLITADIPLAHAAIQKGGAVINPRGELYSENNIRQRLSRRNFNEELRSSGVITGGPNKISKKEVQDFSNQLDQILYKKLNQ